MSSRICDHQHAKWIKFLDYTFRRPFFTRFSLPIPIPGRAPPSHRHHCRLQQPLSPPASLFVPLVSVRSYSRLFLRTSNLRAPTRSSDRSFVRVFSHFSFYSVALRRSRLRKSSPRLTPVLQYRCIDTLQHRFQTYTKTIRIQARKSRIRNSLRTEIKPLEYEYNKCSGFNLKIYFRNLLDSLRLHPYRSTMLNFNKSVLATVRFISFFSFYICFIRFSFCLVITFRNFDRDTLILARTTSCDAHPSRI